MPVSVLKPPSHRTGGWEGRSSRGALVIIICDQLDALGGISRSIYGRRIIDVNLLIASSEAVTVQDGLANAPTASHCPYRQPYKRTT